MHRGFDVSCAVDLGAEPAQTESTASGSSASEEEPIERCLPDSSSSEAHMLNHAAFRALHRPLSPRRCMKGARAREQRQQLQLFTDASTSTDEDFRSSPRRERKVRFDCDCEFNGNLHARAWHAQVSHSAVELPLVKNSILAGGLEFVDSNGEERAREKLSTSANLVDRRRRVWGAREIPPQVKSLTTKRTTAAAPPGIELAPDVSLAVCALHTDSTGCVWEEWEDGVITVVDDAHKFYKVRMASGCVKYFTRKAGATWLSESSAVVARGACPRRA